MKGAKGEEGNKDAISEKQLLALNLRSAIRQKVITNQDVNF